MIHPYKIKVEYSIGNIFSSYFFKQINTFKVIAINKYIIIKTTNIFSNFIVLLIKYCIILLNGFTVKYILFNIIMIKYIIINIKNSIVYNIEIYIFRE